jgi:hypothetical protein
MPDSGLIVLSLVCLAAGVGFLLFPHPLLAISQAMNRTLVPLDAKLVRFRYISGVFLFVASYLCFRLALDLPGVVN